MKIGVITYSLFSHGGVQRVTSTVFNELSEEHDIEFIYVGKLPYNKGLLYDLNEEKIRIERHPFKMNIVQKFIKRIYNQINDYTGIFNNVCLSGILSKVLYPKSLRYDLIDYLNSKNYDIVIAIEGDITMAIGTISEKIRAKTIGWQHNSYNAYYYTKRRYYWNKEYLAKKLFSKLDSIIVLTEEDKIAYKNKMGIECIKMKNPLSFKSEKKSLCNNKNILCVSRIDIQQKGLDLLVEAFKRISDYNDEYKLTIVGDGPDKEKLYNIINDYNMNDKIILKPFSDNIEEEYLNASLFVSSSRWEGFGVVIIEAMECGLPIIAYRNSGPKEIIRDGIDGILVENENINKLAEAMNELINNEEKRLNMSKNSILRAKEFSKEDVAIKWNDLIKKNLSKVDKVWNLKI